uniref:Viral protein 3 n=1 Tax=Porcine rotavirus H TaxID=1420855 RepID=A0A3G9GJY0_9REOV|nr:viral protein 3 [Porcine rotavirus H]
MAKLVIINSAKGELAETHEDIFKISNLTNREVFVRANERTAEIFRKQTFYTVLDVDNVPKDNDAFRMYNDLFPTTIFKTSEDNFLFGTCNHILYNTIHYSYDLFDSMVSELSTYLPSDWKIEKIIDAKDYPIGNDILFYIFDNLNKVTIDDFVRSKEKHKNVIPKCSESEDRKKEILSEILQHVYEPAIEYDPQSYNYRVSRREIGKLVRSQVFKMLNGTVHLIGPEMESVKDIIIAMFEGIKFIFYTIDGSRYTTYEAEIKYNKREKLTLSNSLIPQRKNQNNFIKGLILHMSKFGVPVRVLYIGSFPSFWLETMQWFPVNIICYDPKFRDVKNDRVIWHAREFTVEDAKQVDLGTYAYIDIRTDIRNINSVIKESKLLEEDELNVQIAVEIAKRKGSAFCKRKIFKMNTVYGKPYFHPNILQLGREYYNYIDRDTKTTIISEDKMYEMLLKARSNNVANYVFEGSKFDENVDVPEDHTVVALYSISNAINSLKTIEKVIAAKHFITFPHYADSGDWRDIKQVKPTPFQDHKKQLEFTDWSINPKAYAKKYQCEVLSESVFLQIGNCRALIPDLYNHMISIRYEMPLFFSDRYFAHIGIRQPSIFKRDHYMTSRIAAYISRQLTHSVDLSNLQKNRFEGYSGHLIAIETSFNSLVYTMSPFRWLVRAKQMLKERNKRDRYRIGQGQPHTKEEFENTYEYLRKNNLINDSFQHMLVPNP